MLRLITGTPPRPADAPGDALGVAFFIEKERKGRGGFQLVESSFVMRGGVMEEDKTGVDDGSMELFGECEGDFITLDLNERELRRASNEEQLHADVAEASKSSLYGSGVLAILVDILRVRKKGVAPPSDHIVVGCYSELSGLWFVDATADTDEGRVSRSLDALFADDPSFGSPKQRRIFWCQALMHGNGGGGGSGEGGAPSGDGSAAAGAAPTEAPPSSAPAPRSRKRSAPPAGAGGVGAAAAVAPKRRKR